MISPPKNRMVTWFFFSVLGHLSSDPRPPPRKLADVGSAAMFGGCLSGGAASDDSFVNPVLPGGFPDPSVCRVSWSTKKPVRGSLGFGLGFLGSFFPGQLEIFKVCVNSVCFLATVFFGKKWWESHKNEDSKGIFSVPQFDV